MQREGAGKDRDVKIFPLVYHPRADQGHQVLATDQATDAADIGLVTDQVATIAGTPTALSTNVGTVFLWRPRILPLRSMNSRVL